jgi:succinoglycan biosynthesis protein ExoV
VSDFSIAGEVRMKLVYFEGQAPNFGDELNRYIWPKLLPPGFFDDDAGELFVGIGSILGDIYPGAARKVVAGSGYGGYHRKPDLNDGSWDILFVRGPRTARLFNLPPEKAIADGALLLRFVDLPAASGPGEIGFMPHYESMMRGNWAAACRLAGLRLIDPRWPVEEVLAAIRAAPVLITEAMHGAIVADLLRVPWVAALPTNPLHHAKWHDWAEALDVELRPHPLRPSSLFEAYVRATGGRRYYDGRAKRWAQSAPTRPIDRLMTQRAAGALRDLARCEPQLSREASLRRASELALAAINKFADSRVVA